MSPEVPAVVFAALAAVVVAFQLALAAGAPWGKAAMGGKFPGTLPPLMRIAAVIQGAILLAFAGVTLARAGSALDTWYGASRIAIWVVVGFSAIELVLNSITPSKLERALWAPVALGMLASSLLVATS